MNGWERGGFGSPIKWDLSGSGGHIRSDEGLGVCIKTVSGQVGGAGTLVTVTDPRGVLAQCFVPWPG